MGFEALLNREMWLPGGSMFFSFAGSSVAVEFPFALLSQMITSLRSLRQTLLPILCDILF